MLLLHHLNPFTGYLLFIQQFSNLYHLTRTFFTWIILSKCLTYSVSFFFLLSHFSSSTLIKLMVSISFLMLHTICRIIYLIIFILPVLTYLLNQALPTYDCFSHLDLTHQILTATLSTYSSWTNWLRTPHWWELITCK